ncbi:MAG: PEGA domain-containing protein [Microgenomates group bacterium]
MKRNWIVGIAAVLGVVLIGLIVKSKFLGQSGPAAISVSTTPRSTVFIDGVQVGTTPFLDDKIQAGEHTVKLVPEQTTNNLVTWEGKVNLTSNILTVINRTLGPTESASSGEIIWLEKISSKDKSSLAVVSIPPQAVVKIDGEPKGFAPVALEDLNPGSYQIVVASPGYEERTVSAKTVAGYKLIVNVQLAKKIEGIEEATPSAEEAEVTPSPKASPTPKTTPKATVTPPEKPYVKIKETPTGWLRVRMEPSTSATEAAKVKPGEMFPYLGEEKTVGGTKWYKIEYEKDKGGWVSGVYVELVE